MQCEGKIQLEKIEKKKSKFFLVNFSEGTRIENCEKNIGRRKFAFGALQLPTYPYQYRPPVGTFQPNQT